MKPTSSLRAVAAGAVAAGLLGAGAVTAVAAPAPPAPEPAAPSVQPSDPWPGRPAVKPSTQPSTLPAAPQTGKQCKKTNTVTADRTRAKAWEQFRLHGKVTGIKPGTVVQLQQKRRGTWKALPATSVVDRSGAYSMRVKLGMRGPQQVRTLVAGHPSNPVRVNVA